METNQATRNSRAGCRRRLRVEYRLIAELKLNPRNPRTHSPKQIRQLARAIETFGFNVPILVDRDLNVLAGHGRVLACRQLGQATVPTILLKHLSEAEARAFVIADNRLAETSEWDDHLLAEQLRELAALELEFDLETVGFELAEIDLRIEGLTNSSAGEEPEVSYAADRWLRSLIIGCIAAALSMARPTKG